MDAKTYLKGREFTRVPPKLVGKIMRMYRNVVWYVKYYEIEDAPDECNWYDMETAGAGWMWLGYKSDRETIKAIRRRITKKRNGNVYLYYVDGKPIMCWWEEKFKCMQVVVLTNDV